MMQDVSSSRKSEQHTTTITVTDSEREAVRGMFRRTSSAIDPTLYSLGLARRRSEMRQLGGLLAILGIGAAHSSLALTALLVEGMGGYDQISGFRLPALIATLTQTFLGMVAMAVGFFTMIHTPTTQRAHLVSKILVFIVNLGPIAFVITIVRLVQGANEPPEKNSFIPPTMDPTPTDVRFVVAMGILSLISVCGTLIGGLTVVGLNLCAYLGGQTVDKHRGYYVIRYAYYNLLTFIGGLSQLLLGVYLGKRFGWGPYEEAVHVTVYTVFFPCLSVIVGGFQAAYGVFGWSRACGWVPIYGKRDDSFIFATLLTWVVTMLLQVIVQPSFGHGSSFDAEGPTYASVYLGFFVMPAWLDWLVRVTPSKIEPVSYGLPRETECKEDFLCKVFGLTEGNCQLSSSVTDRSDSSSSSYESGVVLDNGTAFSSSPATSFAMSSFASTTEPQQRPPRQPERSRKRMQWMEPNV